MSRSYKRTPVVKDRKPQSRRYAKRQASKAVRHFQMLQMECSTVRCMIRGTSTILYLFGLCSGWLVD